MTGILPFLGAIFKGTTSKKIPFEINLSLHQIAYHLVVLNINDTSRE
jgi:hypothetical protein